MGEFILKAVVFTVCTALVLGLVAGIVALQAWVAQLVVNFAIDQFHVNHEHVTFYQALAGVMLLNLIGGFFKSSSSSSSKS